MIIKRTREWWDRYYLKIAKDVATASKDPSTQVGAVVVNYLNQLVGTGYNGFPRGVPDDEELLADKLSKYPRMVHAEVNALLVAGERARGGKIYVYPTFDIPNICDRCCAIAIQMGIKEVIGYPVEDGHSSWKESIAVARDMSNKSNLKYRIVKPE